MEADMYLASCFLTSTKHPLTSRPCGNTGAGMDWLSLEGVGWLVAGNDFVGGEDLL